MAAIKSAPPLPPAVYIVCHFAREVESLPLLSVEFRLALVTSLINRMKWKWCQGSVIRNLGTSSWVSWKGFLGALKYHVRCPTTLKLQCQGGHIETFLSTVLLGPRLLVSSAKAQDLLDSFLRPWRPPVHPPAEEHGVLHQNHMEKNHPAEPCLNSWPTNSGDIKKWLLF